jgi:hypothetical protein
MSEDLIMTGDERVRTPPYRLMLCLTRGLFARALVGLRATCRD